MPDSLFRSRRRSSWLLAAVLTLPLLAGTARAQIGSDRYASIVVDAATGNILSAANADEPRYPASLTKMMTIYMLFEALRDRRVAWNDPVPVSAWASSMSPTKLGLMPGSFITVEQALLGLVTKSANDAAAALGEMMGGDEDRFAQMMTLRARALGMSRTTFRNASGLPDWNQTTTARDLAILARHLIQDFPTYYHVFSTPSFHYAGRTIFNHQRMLQSYPGADGLKTGYIDASGYNVVVSALRGDTRLIGVTMGASTGGERDQHMAMLLDQGFDRLGVAPLFLARREPGFRMPSLIGTAHAAPVRMAAPPVQVAEAPAFRRRAPLRPAAEPRYAAEPRPAARAPAPRQAMRPAAARVPEAIVQPVRAREIPLRRPATRTAHGGVPGRYPG